MERFNKTETKLINQLAVRTKPETIENRFGGESVELEPIAVALYDYIMGCEMVQNWNGMQKGLTMFRKYWGSEYMVLLD